MHPGDRNLNASIDFADFTNFDEADPANLHLKVTFKSFSISDRFFYITSSKAPDGREILDPRYTYSMQIVFLIYS